MADLDRQRAEVLMQQAGIDALIMFSPESFQYASGAPAGVATMWRSAGAVAVLVPAQATLPETAVVSDLFVDLFQRHSHIEDWRVSPIWVETTTLATVDTTLSATSAIANAWRDEGRLPEFNRPTTFNPDVCFQHLRQALEQHGLAGKRVGFEGSAVSVAEFAQLQEVLAGVELVDASDVIGRLKMVKSSREIDHLRQAVSLAEQGINAIRDAIALGVTRDELAEHWHRAIETHRGDIALTGSWEYISVGPDPWGGNKAIEPGDLVKVDVGCLVNGYTSDSARTFVFGQPTSLQTELYTALSAGFAAGRKLLQPGVALADVHKTTLSAIRAAGFPGYTRGHFGHGLGASVGSEQWPFIAADSNVVFEPGMVMAFECPWYINGLGGMIIENQLLITDDGHEMMNTLPLELHQCSG